MPGPGLGQAARMDIYIRILRCALSKNPNVVRFEAQRGELLVGSFVA
jgi:hypothetical protein